MGAARLAVYLIGLLAVVAAAWILLTQTPLGESIPSGIAIAIILLIVGIGVMASAKSVNDSRTTRRVVHEGAYGPAVAPPPAAPGRVYDTRYDTAYTGPTETVVEERRYD